MVWYLQSAPRDSAGLMYFHDIQSAILSFRENRIKNYKTVFPRLSLSSSSDSSRYESSEALGKKRNPSKTIRYGKVSTSVAPATMFQHMKGMNNSDVLQAVWLIV